MAFHESITRPLIICDLCLMRRQGSNLQLAITQGVNGKEVDLVRFFVKACKTCEHRLIERQEEILRPRKGYSRERAIGS